MKAKMVVSCNFFDLEKEINDNIEIMENENHKIVDIKLFGDKARALILYN